MNHVEGIARDKAESGRPAELRVGDHAGEIAEMAMVEIARDHAR